jgi:hypothetical protein
MPNPLPTQTYHQIDEWKTGTEYLRNKLKLKHLEAKRKFSQKHAHVEKFFQKKGLEMGKIRQHSAKIIGASALAGTLALAQPQPLGNLPLPPQAIEKVKSEKAVAQVSPKESLLTRLGEVLPKKTRPLTREEEKGLEGVLAGTVNIPAKATLEGEHLNTTYGLIGAEQHLRRFPGDTMTIHPRVPEDDEGMAPGLGAWGYFARSKPNLTNDLVETEKWYAVVQTLYLPDWGRRQPYLRDWYKFRKVLIVNTQNGQAVVAAIADSGPAAWTGKHFGGSPEVMNHLGGPRYKKGPVLVFFVDDPENKIPLGPVEYSSLPLAVKY